MKTASLARHTEADVQAELYHQARLRGMKPRLEAPFDSPNGHLRADCAFHADGSAYALVEVKRVHRSRRRKKSRQQLKYEAVGVPWRYCEGFDQIQEVLDWAEALRPDPLKSA